MGAFVSPNDGILNALAQDKAAGQVVVDGTLARRESDEETVEQKIIPAEDRDVRKKTTAAKTQASSPEINGLASEVDNIDAQQAFAERCTPCGALREAEVEPAFGCKKS